MFKDFDKYLSEYDSEIENYAIDYWYDEGATIACEMISQFMQKDWADLSNEMLSRNLGWQKKLAYCLDDKDNVYELDILLALVNTHNEDLFEICVDSLRTFDNKKSVQLILKNPQIVQRVNVLLPSCGVATKKVYENFLKKLNIESLIN